MLRRGLEARVEEGASEARAVSHGCGHDAPAARAQYARAELEVCS